MQEHTGFDLPDRFWAKTRDVESGCLIWTASKNNQGYGQFAWEGKTQSAHRLAYRAAWGEIPEGLHIDHLCRVRECVNPNHLEAVTQRVNNVRAVPFRSTEFRTRRLRFVTHHFTDPVNGAVYHTHRDYPHWRRMCRRCPD